MRLFADNCFGPPTFNLQSPSSPVFQILGKVSNVFQVVHNPDIKGAFRFPAWDFGNCTCSMERYRLTQATARFVIVASKQNQKEK